MFVLCAAACAGCATRPAPDIPGRWKPVNHFAESVQEIPLHQSYVFYPSPMDGTLKNMLERWSLDSSMTLRYLHPSDFTLHGSVAGMRTGNLAEATHALNGIYSRHGVAIALEGDQIMVRQAGAKGPLAKTPAAMRATKVP
jgi:hypothetical protein